MARPSQHPQPRESVYPSHQIPSDFLHSLEECVVITEECCATLEAGLTRLEPGVRDLPRLKRVLGNEHRFLLLPQPTIQTHLQSLSSSLAPQIEALIARAEGLLETQRQSLGSLEERYAVLCERAERPRNQFASVSGRDLSTELETGTESEGETENGTGNTGSKLDGLELKELSIPQRRKVVMLRNKRERLEKELERLGGDAAGGV